ncbi:G-protein coupled bile acid receptor 1-like [Arapaima gigas]
MDLDTFLGGGHLIYSITIPLSTVIILTNLLILVGIVSNRKLHNTPNYFFVSLLVADLCTGTALPFMPWMGVKRRLDFTTCLLVHIFPNFVFLSFLSNLVMVHYERYLCIVNPLHYCHWWANRCFPLALLAVWVPPLLYALLPAFGWNNWGVVVPGNRSVLEHNDTAEHRNGSLEAKDCSYRIVFPKDFIYLEVYGLLLPAILSMVFMTVRVLLIARAQLRDICRLHRSVGCVSALDAEHRLNLRYVRCIATVSLTFLVCWVPYIVYLHLSVALLRSGTLPTGNGTHIILSCTSIGSTAIVPIVLGLGNRQYTEPARKLLSKLCDRTRAPPPVDPHNEEEEQPGPVIAGAQRIAVPCLL